MRNIFRRKSIQANIPKVAEEPPTHNISLLSEGKKISGSELTNLLSEIIYQKLKLIFQKNPQLQKYITLYKFSKLPAKYQEFRQQTLKDQITKGLDLVLKLEDLIFLAYDKNKHLIIESPCPELMHLIQPHQDWNNSCHINYTIRQIFDSINEIASLKINQNKNLTIYLLSLLTSLDAIPPDSIPIIDFDELIVNKDHIINDDPQCQSLLSAISKLEVDNRRTIEKITMFKHKYDDTTPDDQTAQFHAIIRSYYDIYDKETHLFTELPQTRIFHDFVAHPKIISSPFYQEFKSGISPDSFKKFIDDILELYNVTDEDDKVISYLLCSLSFLPIAVETINLGISENCESASSSDASDAYLDLAFEVFVTVFPVSTLAVISIFSEKEGKPVEEVLQKMYKSLQLFTPKWKEILSFVVNYSIPKFIPEKLQSIRQAISATIF